MARTVEDIQAQIITQVQNTPQLGVLSTSKTALWRLWTYIVASAIRLMEVNFDNHKKEITTQILALKPHTTRWYQARALAYQHGRSLVDGEDYYDNTGLQDAQIDTEKIIKRAAVLERGDTLQIKVAKFTTQAAPLDLAQLTAFKDYVNDIKDAGVKVEVISAAADSLRLTADVYYDAKVLDATGARLDGTNAAPVQAAILSFLNSLPFNGVLKVSDLVDALQQVEGVETPVLRLCQASYVLSPNAWFNLDAYWITYAGYIQLDDADLTLNYIEYAV